MNKESSSPGATSPMLYDPLPNNAVQTTKTMQFVAAVFGEHISCILNIKSLQKNRLLKSSRKLLLIRKKLAKLKKVSCIFQRKSSYID